ncbi:hypothetical protein [Xylophilus sp.]|uniref:hypothetical protein n=1 Tax=Xylophilus sp. TaxID=2653893 RepID=UPI0013BD661F|nr:hypothetical protein [Xylophilus sp.]KAF1043625.1 MAG: hypothetical protein GAK38_03886 [Xylophilus sp.]
MTDDTATPAPAWGRQHARRLRELYRSAGWPCQDIVEIELLAGGMLERLVDDRGRETLRLTEAGLRLAAAQAARNRAALSAHEALAQRVAAQLAAAGRIAWRGLALRARLPAAAAEGVAPAGADLLGEPAAPAPPGALWGMVRPDVFSIRNTTVATYVEPVVHEVKVQRSDLLADLKRPAKRGAYLDLGACWYVLGSDARGRCIADPSEVPAECGVLVEEGGRLVAARNAPPPARAELPLAVWMALARAVPYTPGEIGVQANI